MSIEVFYDSGNVSLDLIENFESKVGLIFPELYKKILSNHNELNPEKSFFKFYNNFIKKEDSRDISFFGYGDKVSKASNIENFQNIDDRIIIGMSASGDYICFDYRDLNNGTPKIVVALHDFTYQNDIAICFVSNDFESFLNKLYCPK